MAQGPVPTGALGLPGVERRHPRKRVLREGALNQGFARNRKETRSGTREDHLLDLLSHTNGQGFL
jgi:hypothetical protein